MILGDLLVLDGDVLRKALAAGRSADRDLLRRWAASVKFRHRTIPSVVGACLVLDGRIASDEPSEGPFAGPDNFDRLVAALSPEALSTDAVPDSVPDAFDRMIANRHVAGMLLRAGYVELSAQIGYSTSVFQHRCRRHFHGTAIRVLTNNWIAAIGHMVVLGFLVKGQNAGLFDYGGTRIWKGGIANRYLLKQIYLKSRNVDFVDRWSAFAENHGSQNLEDVDGEIVDCFTACGIVADRAGDSQGAILPRPGRNLPVLADFFKASGLDPSDRLVTVHCRDAGFRRDAYHDLRNSDIATFLPAIEWLTRQGYRVVRLGDGSMPPLPAMEGVFDYALSELKSEELDVLLPAVAAFHIGSSSGLSLVPLLFGTPCLFLNWHPFELLPWGRRNWTVLKPIEALGDHRRVIDRDGYAPLGLIRDRPLLNSFGYDVVDLDGEEIERAVTGFVAAQESNPDEPAKTGPNISRLFVADDHGCLRNLG